MTKHTILTHPVKSLSGMVCVGNVCELMAALGDVSDNASLGGYEKRLIAPDTGRLFDGFIFWARVYMGEDTEEKIKELSEYLVIKT